MLVVAVIAPGAMGAAVGQVLARHGAGLWTLLAGHGLDVRMLAGLVGAAPGLRTSHAGITK